MITAPARSAPLATLLAGLCALLVIVGSFGPWAKVLIITVDGMDEDGGVTLFLGLVALAIAGLRVLRPEGRQRWMWGRWSPSCWRR